MGMKEEGKDYLKMYESGNLFILNENMMIYTN